MFDFLISNQFILPFFIVYVCESFRSGVKGIKYLRQGEKTIKAEKIYAQIQEEL